ncbi:hypothetical protein PPERSA_13174 [Pseudocohnilembus persalinus]|uniref:EF-hand domain-containing protein n=1 Tax=Pseudocohnilembus persalinus TaxID=266149 RepID=A0A0V0QLF7_PSEPJ|nr:hypothetical protein PPERSA_13174 [Pseudocohnilembus persalinus]|eukprot:KRX02920.1 hypothetical protein PPERSA_13174 [Pseudocohnilembus persalinus]
MDEKKDKKGGKNYSEDELMNAIEKLKKKMKLMKIKQQKLQMSYSQQLNGKNKKYTKEQQQKLIDSYYNFSQKAILIQKIWRGYITREKFRNNLLNIIECRYLDSYKNKIQENLIQNEKSRQKQQLQKQQNQQKQEQNQSIQSQNSEEDDQILNRQEQNYQQIQGELLLKNLNLDNIKNKNQKLGLSYSQFLESQQGLFKNLERKNQDKKNQFQFQFQQQEFEKEESAFKIAFGHLKIKNMSFETIYRCLDQKKEGKIKMEEFQKLFEKLTFDCKKLKNELRSRIYYLLDEEVSGFVSKIELHKALETYGVQGNDNLFENHPRTLEQDMLLKLAFHLKIKNISPIQAFNAIDKSSNNKVSQQEIFEFLEALSIQFDRKDQIALMKIFDNQSQGEIQKEDFIIMLSKAYEHKTLQYLLNNKNITAKFSNF